MKPKFKVGQKVKVDVTKRHKGIPYWGATPDHVISDYSAIYEISDVANEHGTYFGYVLKDVCFSDNIPFVFHETNLVDAQFDADLERILNDL